MMSLISNKSPLTADADLRREKGRYTSGMSLDHQLINRFELGIIVDSHSLGLDIGHVDGSRTLEVWKGFGDEET